MTISKSQMKRIAIQKEARLERKSWNACHECQIKSGGKIPEGQRGITVMKGKCSECGEVRTLVPNDDYNWPHKKARVD